MEKLFHKAEETPINGSYYYLLKKYGRYARIIGEGEWEEDNECFYDNNDDRTYYLNDIDYYMETPDQDQLDNL